jgi:hypothetical protein
MGNIRTFNEGLSLTRGDYVGLISADDLAARSDAVERQVAVLDRHPEVAFVYSATQRVDANGNLTSVLRPWDEDYVITGHEELERLIWSNHVPGSGTLVRRTCHEELGWYDEKLPCAGDWDLWMRLATRHSVAYLTESLYAYRIHDSNMSHSKVRPKQAAYEQALTIDRNFALLPASSELRASWDDARKHAMFAGIWIDLGHRRRRRVWEGLAAIARQSPRLLTDRTYHAWAASRPWWRKRRPPHVPFLSRSRRQTSIGARWRSC